MVHNGLVAFKEMTISWKSYFSNNLTARLHASSIPSIVTPWYLATKSNGTEPLLTPIRIAIFFSFALSIICLNCFSSVILPGLMRIFAIPVSITFKANK